ncbi:hypothetical protein ABTW96_32740 [Nocardia beijingensis]
MLVELLGAHADPESPFEIAMSDELLVDADAPVSYLTPVSLRRTKSLSVASIVVADIVEEAVEHD